jgi:hypothetical protein
MDSTKKMVEARRFWPGACVTTASIPRAADVKLLTQLSALIAPESSF